MVTLVTPFFATAASWVCALVAKNVPNAPRLNAASIRDVEIAAFLGTVGIVGKWLHGRQKPELITPPHETPLLLRSGPPSTASPDQQA